MGKAIFAAIVTTFIGWFFADLLYQLPEIGSIIAVAVMVCNVNKSLSSRMDNVQQLHNAGSIV